MAAEKKEVEVTVFLNKGLRHYDLGFGVDGKPRRHSPGQTMAYTAEEAARHSGYADLVDVAKMPGVVDVKQLKSENAQLADQNAKLKAQLAALEAKPAKVKVEVKPEPKKEVKEAAKA